MGPEYSFITGPPTHSVGGQTSNGRCMASVVVCRLSASSVTRRICNVTHQGTARGGPVVLRLVRATPCFEVTKTDPAWVFALLWVLASSS